MKKLMVWFVAGAAASMALGDTLDTSMFNQSCRFVLPYYRGASTLVDFPVAVRLSEGVGGFHYAQCAANGADLRFADADGNLIPHEIECWVPTGESVVWVKIPSLSGTDTGFKMYFGQKADAELPTVDPRDVWTKYVTVVHGGGGLADSSPKQAAVANGGGVSATMTSGIIGGGVTKPTRNTIGLNVANPVKNSYLTNADQFTLSAWYRFTGTGTDCIASSETAWNKGGFLLLCEGGNYMSCACTGHQPSPSNNKGRLIRNEWNHVGFSYVRTGEGLCTYVDGKQVYSVAASQVLGDPGLDNWTFGGYAQTTQSANHGGDMDEMRIYDGIATADWMKAEYDSVKNPMFASVVGTTDKVLDADRNYVGMGKGTFFFNDVVDLNGHKLYVDPDAFNGVKFTDSSTGEPGELHVVVAEGKSASLAAIPCSGNLKLVKDGAGRLTIPTCGVATECSAGELSLAVSNHLIHRWSFTNGSLEDSVGGGTATTAGSASGTVTFANNAVTLPGGNTGVAYVDLGANLIPPNGETTLEFWATHNASQSYSRVFTIGTADNNKIGLFWTCPTDVAKDAIQIKANGTDVLLQYSKLAPFDYSTEFHISLTFQPQADGTTRVTWTKRDAVTGAVLKTANAVTSRPWSIGEYAACHLWLGHGYINNDAAATYNEVRVWDYALSEKELTANAVAGPDALPEGTGEAPTLLHRWSFTGGSLADSVGDSTAAKAGSNGDAAVLDNNAVSLPGGGNGSCYIDLGGNVVPSTGDATIEIWGTQDTARSYSRVFSIGTSDVNKFTMIWSYGTDVNTDAVQLKINRSDLIWQRDTMAPFTLGTKFHISVVFRPNEDGSTTVTWTKRDAVTGAVLKSGSASPADWNLGMFAACHLWLGHGYSNDDAAATFDEVRVWKGAMTPEQLEISAKLGPDQVTTMFGAGKCGTVEIDAGATLSTQLGGVTGARLAGTGTLLAGSEFRVSGAFDIAGTEIGDFTVNGILKILGDWVLDGGENHVADRVVGSGTLDLTEANLAPRFKTGAVGPHLIVEDTVNYLGHAEMKTPKDCYVEVENGKLYLKRFAFVIYVR